MHNILRYYTVAVKYRMNIVFAENQKSIFNVKIVVNKRAQRALGRSPEENVKGNSGANYREPQGHNLNNFGRGPFDDVIYKI